ncbi:MAG TPA: hypothetical protein VNM45_13540 [Bacillus sp. (in: firmicutes)]|nr:hypothetical protein [Bacillus sp. (in: firmicutes)]
MNDKKQSQHVYEYDETGIQQTQQLLNDAYVSGIVGGGFTAPTYENSAEEVE